MADLRSATELGTFQGTWWLPATACAAIAAPSLIAFNVPPSATFFNQAAALVGWGGFLLAIGVTLPKQAWPRASGALSLLAAMTLMFIAALAPAALTAAPWSLSLSSAGTILSAMLVIAVGASTQRVGSAFRVFRAFCIALVVAGTLSSLIGVIQIFAPGLPDGDWIALPAILGRASGNLRQPNHLSSLLLWSIVAAVWVAEARVLRRDIAVGLALAFIYVVVLSASRTGAIGMLTLAGWALLDRRLSRSARIMLVLTPVIYGAMWWGTTIWATHGHQLFGGQTRLGGGGDISNARFAIWSHVLSLISTHPWLGVGFGEFNFAWTLSPFADRPDAFFDHTHNLILNFLVELGLPLGGLVLSLMGYALWRAFVIAFSKDNSAASSYPVQRAAFVIVALVLVHSMFEYPLWYSYFLLPAAFAFGLCLERPAASEAGALTHDVGQHDVARPYVLAAMFLVLGGTLALYDYMRVVVIFAPPARAAPLEQRISEGQRSILFGHHADYAAATIAEHPGKVIESFKRASHYLLDTRLITAWAKALEERGESEKARYVAARMKEFPPDKADGFFFSCGSPPAPASAVPFQCDEPKGTFRFEDFR